MAVRSLKKLPELSSFQDQARVQQRGRTKSKKAAWAEFISISGHSSTMWLFEFEKGSAERGWLVEFELCGDQLLFESKQGILAWKLKQISYVLLSGEMKTTWRSTFSELSFFFESKQRLLAWKLKKFHFVYVYTSLSGGNEGYLRRELIYKVINSCFRENITNIFLDNKHFMYIGGESKRVRNLTVSSGSCLGLLIMCNSTKNALVFGLPFNDR